jgi:hypothetical protein
MAVLDSLKFVVHKYPSLSFRLSKEHLRRLRVLATIKNRTRSEVVREAIDLYFRSVTSSNGIAVVYSNPSDLLSDLLSEQAGNSELNQYSVDTMETDVLCFQDEIDYPSHF